MRIHTGRVTAAVALAVFVLLSSTVAPQSGFAQEESAAKALLEKSLEASGGAEKAAHWKTMTEKGELTVHWEGWGTPHAECTRYVKRPDKMVLDQDFSKYDNPFFFTYFYNGGDVWAVVNLGVRQNPRYTAMMTRAMKNTGGMFYYATECDTLFLVADVPDDSLVAASTINRIGIVDQGDTVFVDLDKKTHLPVRRIESGGTQHVLLGDYRETGGLKVPFRVTVYQNGAVAAEYVWEKIEFDTPIDDAKFEEYRPAKKPEASD